MTAREMLAELQRQHDGLRAIMDRCDALADQLDSGKSVAGALAREVANLRLALDAHNKAEEQMLRDLLRTLDASTEVRIDRMYDDHVSEHRSMRLSLGDATTNALRGAVDSLRAHLAAEERYLFSVHHHDD